MTSYCDVTKSVYPVAVTTKRHSSILEVGRGAYSQAVALGVTRPLHATGKELHSHCRQWSVTHQFYLNRFLLFQIRS